jgi:hypothetical protein
MLIKLHTLVCLVFALMNISFVNSFGSEDTKYYQTFKGVGKLNIKGGKSFPPVGSESPTGEFYGAIKRVIKKDSSQGMELYFFVWE